MALGLTYLMLFAENVVRLGQPLLLGWAVNDVIRGQRAGLAAFAAGHLMHLVVRSLRQMYDTRTFSQIYNDRVIRLVTRQRKRGVDVSRVAARAELSRQFVTFSERQVPAMITAMFSCLGALVMLGFYDALLIAACAVLILPAVVLNTVYGRQTLRISLHLHDQFEREVGVVARAEEGEVRGHYERIARLNVRLSDFEAWTAGIMELFVLALLVFALVHIGRRPDFLPGDVFAVFRYLLMFVTAVDAVPLLVERFSRLRDVAQRVQSPG
ncbi:MAG: hypothetical protein HUU20_17500 [Pirellulales bacterium]|nr:hypothetical protein [Pirellulales bacterium]